MKTIIVPVDFSPASDNACYYAIKLAKDVNAKIIILHAFESTVLYSQIPMLTAQLDYSYLYNAAVKKMQSYLKKISKSANKVEIEISVQQGLPSARIIELASEKKADMIIMGTTGKGKVERVLMGSNASRTIKNAPCMVLVIPPKAIYHGFQKIVYATDMTKGNLKHAQRLIPFGKLFNSEIVFLNVGLDVVVQTEKESKKYKSKIKEVMHYPKTSGFVAIDEDIPNGIDYFLKYHKADCLAVYTHQRSIISSLFSKSIAKQLTIHASIPVLVLHANDHEEEIPRHAIMERVN